MHSAEVYSIVRTWKLAIGVRQHKRLTNVLLFFVFIGGSQTNRCILPPTVSEWLGAQVYFGTAQRY